MTYITLLAFIYKIHIKITDLLQSCLQPSFFTWKFLLLFCIFFRGKNKNEKIITILAWECLLKQRVNWTNKNLWTKIKKNLWTKINKILWTKIKCFGTFYYKSLCVCRITILPLHKELRCITILFGLLVATD